MRNCEFEGCKFADVRSIGWLLVRDWERGMQSSSETWEAFSAALAGTAATGTASLGPREPDNDMVICPNCTCQFVAIPVNVQKRLRDAVPASVAPRLAHGFGPDVLEHIAQVSGVGKLTVHERELLMDGAETIRTLQRRLEEAQNLYLAGPADQPAATLCPKCNKNATGWATCVRGDCPETCPTDTTCEHRIVNQAPGIRKCVECGALLKE